MFLRLLKIPATRCLDETRSGLDAAYDIENPDARLNRLIEVAGELGRTDQIKDDSEL
jgi:hypothetical protein